MNIKQPCRVSRDSAAETIGPHTNILPSWALF